MLSAVWRISLAPGTALSVLDEILRLIPGPCAIHREGSADAGGRRYGTSGLNYAVSQGPELQDVLDDTTALLDSLDLIQNRLRSYLPSPSELDLGFTVGGLRHFTRTVRFPPSLLQRLAFQNICLAVSAYPSSDE
jgi:hypothetical protein